MKPFNLQAALAGAKVVTRDGREVKIAGYSKDVNSLLGWIGSGVYQWTGGGQNIADKNDLFMAPIERKEWIVRISDTCIFGPYKTSADAYDAILRLAMPTPATIHEILIVE
jgi:hypothetical protein